MTLHLRHPFLQNAIFSVAIVTSLISVTAAKADDDDDNEAPNPASAESKWLPSGQRITPQAIPGSTFQLFNPGLPDFPNFSPNGGMTTVVNLDKTTLLALTAGYNRQNDRTGKVSPEASSQYVFVYDITNKKPIQKQVIKISNTYDGITFDPNGKTFYVAGGVDDNIHSYALQADGIWAESGSPISLGHTTTNSVTPKDVPSGTAGLAVTADGSKLVVSNLYNDSISVVDIANRMVTKEIDLRPGIINPAQSGVPGGEYPDWIAIKGNNTAYVSSLRDREIVVVNIGPQPAVTSRIKVKGSPNRMILNKAQSRLFVASDFQDLVSVIDTKTNRVVETIRTTGPDYVTCHLQQYRGSIPNSLALSPDECTLYVTNGGTNSVAVIKLLPWGGSVVIGLLPTQFYPNSVSVSADGKMLYVINQKSPTGPNPESNNVAANQYVLCLQRAGLLSFPVPDLYSMEQLTLTVAANNRFTSRPNPNDERVMAVLRKRIRHIIYIVKENRTYDQILGDLGTGNGDPYIVQYGKSVTPNFHKIASEFVNLDNYYTPGDVSGNGWPWSTAARESDYGMKAITLNYSGRGFSYDTEGTNRDIDISYPTLQQRIAANPATQNDPNILPGQADVTAPDGPNGQEGKGYIWDAALRRGLTIRDYGFFSNNIRYSGPNAIPEERDPHSKNLQVQYPSKPELIANMDPYFRGFDNAFPDFWREIEWEREFSEFEKNGNLPNLSLVRFMHDHTGNFNDAIDGVNTPETQQADNDYAVGKLVERIAHSCYKDDTLIFVIEDDSQNGEDHVDAHRSTAYVVGPYVKHNTLVSNHYTTVNMVRTIEDILGLEHLNIYTATFRPMTACFDLRQKDWTFTSKPSSYLVNNTQLPVPRPANVSADAGKSTHDVAYWAAKTAEFDFSTEDNLKDPEKFNRIIWEGLKGDQPYPVERSGRDLRANRHQLLKRAGLLYDDQENQKKDISSR